MFRNQKRSLQNSMKPGKRNCGRRKQSAWRGQYCLFPVSVCPTCTSTPSLSSAMSCQCDTTPCSFISCFSPHCAVCLNFFTYLSYFNCTHSVFFTFPYLSSHSAAQTSLKHPFSPFTHSSVAAVINHVTVSLVPISACCHSTDHFL